MQKIFSKNDFFLCDFLIFPLFNDSKDAENQSLFVFRR